MYARLHNYTHRDKQTRHCCCIVIDLINNLALLLFICLCVRVYYICVSVCLLNSLLNVITIRNSSLKGFSIAQKYVYICTRNHTKTHTHTYLSTHAYTYTCVDFLQRVGRALECPH